MPPLFDASSPASRTGGSRASTASLRVHVADATGIPVARCLVALRRVTGHVGPDLPCRFDARGRCYAVAGLAPGEYLLIAQARGLAAQRRRVQLAPGLSEHTIVLGPASAALLPRGGGVVPLVADGTHRVAVQLDLAGDDGARAVLETARSLRLEGRTLSREVRRAGVLVFDLPPHSHTATPGVQQERLRSVLQHLERTPGVRHAGSVLPGVGTAVAFLTRDAVLAVEADRPADRVRAFAAAHGFDVMRPLACRRGLWHLRTDEMPTSALLARLQAMSESPEVEWVEPSLVIAGAPEAPPSAERAPRDPHDASVARLPAAEALVESLRIAHGTRPASVLVLASHGVDRLGAEGPVAVHRGPIGSDLDIVDRLTECTTGALAADILLLLPAIGAGLPPSAMVRAALCAASAQGRGGLGTLVLMPHVVAEGPGRAVASIEQPLALHPCSVVVNASMLDAEGQERAPAGISDGWHTTVCAPASQPPVAAAPATAARLVAQIVQLMLAVHPTLPAAEVRRLLRATAERIDLGQADGAGAWLDVRGEPAQATGALPAFSGWYGYGRADALRAVAAAQSRRAMVGASDTDAGVGGPVPPRADGGTPPRPVVAAPRRAAFADVMVSGGHGVEGQVLRA